MEGDSCRYYTTLKQNQHQELVGRGSVRAVGRDDADTPARLLVSHESRFHHEGVVRAKHRHDEIE
jgi:hypothetical protein